MRPAGAVRGVVATSIPAATDTLRRVVGGITRWSQSVCCDGEFMDDGHLPLAALGRSAAPWVCRTERGWRRATHVAARRVELRQERRNIEGPQRCLLASGRRRRSGAGAIDRTHIRAEGAAETAARGGSRTVCRAGPTAASRERTGAASKSSADDAAPAGRAQHGSPRDADATEGSVPCGALPWWLVLPWRQSPTMPVGYSSCPPRHSTCGTSWRLPLTSGRSRRSPPASPPNRRAAQHSGSRCVGARRCASSVGQGSDDVTLGGDPAARDLLLGVLDTPDPDCAIVTP
ncbi:hypothetical protein SAMN05414137_10718 [Streptacidiphilus jiangxiensis]|uniref:Uncharacterized protein n=1 Tax=Streptacidiphilus jiangxiensis TaxID=235985 RepID=A0A1H7NR04_STRJI|nr:hypothetical protein SAMN05414137_10718 [Streptacidiphilus jiangxiensis]